MERSREDAHRSIFEAWNAQRHLRFPSTKGHPTKLDPTRRAAVDAALKLGFSVDQLTLAVRGFVLDASREDDTRSFVWALADAAAIERAMGRAIEIDDRRRAAAERALPVAQ